MKEFELDLSVVGKITLVMFWIMNLQVIEPEAEKPVGNQIK